MRVTYNDNSLGGKGKPVQRRCELHWTEVSQSLQYPAGLTPTISTWWQIKSISPAHWTCTEQNNDCSPKIRQQLSIISTQTQNHTIQNQKRRNDQRAKEAERFVTTVQHLILCLTDIKGTDQIIINHQLFSFRVVDSRESPGPTGRGKYLLNVVLTSSKMSIRL